MPGTQSFKELCESKTNSKPLIKPINNIKNTSTSQKLKLTSSNRYTNKNKTKLIKTPNKEEENIDHFYIENLQSYVKELADENYELRKKNSELESLLAASKDDLECHEEALLEIGKLFEELELKYNSLSNSSKCAKAKEIKDKKA